MACVVIERSATKNYSKLRVLTLKYVHRKIRSITGMDVLCCNQFCWKVGLADFCMR